LAKLKSSANQQKKSVLSKTISFFIQSKHHAYLVGGYVRDITLGIEHRDIDIVVEGDAIIAAKQLNIKLKGNLDIHKKFGTASITTKQMRIDLASARVEKYVSPAKLPHVYPSTINEDLNRRDFTINAMAMSISNENFGEIFDPFNGMEDIKKGIIRVLHKESFNDDPTRIFRALRYKNRFGFKIGKGTRALMTEATNRRMIQRLTDQRILNEIRLIFEETNYQDIVKDISSSRSLKIGKKDMELLPVLGPNRMYFYLSKLKCFNFPITSAEKRLVKDFHDFNNTIARLDKAIKHSAIFAILSPISSEIIDIMPAALSRLKRNVRIFRQLKKKKLFVTGNDLKRLGYKPGAKFRSILNQIRDWQFDGKIKNRKEALEYLRNIKH